MRAGPPPFLGSTAREIVARHSLDPVPPLRASRPDLPAALERAVFKALAKAPADRFATAGAFSEALTAAPRSEEHTSELQSQSNLVCRLLLEKKKREAIY